MVNQFQVNPVYNRYAQILTKNIGRPTSNNMPMEYWDPSVTNYSDRKKPWRDMWVLYKILYKQNKS